MEQNVSDKNVGLSQETDDIYSVTIEGSPKNTQYGVCFQNKKDPVLEDSGCHSGEISRKPEHIKELVLSSNPSTIQQCKASNIPKLVISPNLHTPAIIISSSGSGQVTTTSRATLASNCIIAVCKSGLSRPTTATHIGLPRIISTIPQQTFSGQVLRISHPIQIAKGSAMTRKNDDVTVQEPSPKALKQDLSLPQPGVDARPRIRLAPISALSIQHKSLKVPPSMPPLLRLPTAPPIYSIPVSSSGPSKSMIHETPIQATYANIPIVAPSTSQGNQNSTALVQLLKNSKHYIPHSPPTKVNQEASFNISLTDCATASYPLQLPGGSKATVSYPVTMPDGSMDEPMILSDNSSTSGGDLSKDANNASKCREYRERSKAKKEQEMKDFQYHLNKNIHLKSYYDKQTETIKKLKAYYLKCLQNKRYKCVEAKPEPSKELVVPSLPVLESSMTVSTESVVISEAIAREDSSEHFTPESSSNQVSAVSFKSCTPVINSIGSKGENMNSLPMVIKKEEPQSGNETVNENNLPMVTIKAEDTELLLANVKSEIMDSSPL